jgi:flavodoxin
MATAVIYYTFGGSCMKEAERFAKEENADCYRVMEAKDRSVLNSVVKGCPEARKRKKADIVPMDIDFSRYQKVIVGCPIWAGYPAPAFNNIIEMIPAGTEVDLYFCSAGGNNGSDAGTRKFLEDKGCRVGSIRNIKTGRGIVKMK